MSEHIITATEANRNLSNILNQVHYQGQSFVIKRGKEVLGRLVPATTHTRTLKITALNDLFKKLPALDPDDQAVFSKSLKEIRSRMKAEKDPWE